MQSILNRQELRQNFSSAPLARKNSLFEPERSAIQSSNVTDTIDFELIKSIIRDRDYWLTQRSGGILLPDGISKLQKVLEKHDKAKQESHNENILKTDLASVVSDKFQKPVSDKRSGPTKTIYDLLYYLLIDPNPEIAAEKYQSLVNKWREFNSSKPQKKM